MKWGRRSLSASHVLRVYVKLTLIVFSVRPMKRESECDGRTDDDNLD